ncbi:MAG: DNA primase [Acidobacteria bacterium]|nr:DNA primase [Acidobacteriota bacterium]MYJ02902.1 DNA primase [Acidobacteriota bacterium]
MARYPSGFIADLKMQADIVRVIQDVVPLRKAGNSYKGLCPFHNEKTPSFHVNPDKGFFHCFGCSTGGDVLKFIELYEKLSFPEAVKALAQRVGVQLPETDDPERDRAAEAEREALVKVHELAAAYFREQLAAPSGAGARAYLEQRGIAPDTTDRLGLGCTPPRRDGLTGHLLDAGQPIELLRKSGLVTESDGRPPIDRFRQRLIIPICRETGSVIAFGGRALGGDQQVKYINSPETALYTKGRTLYGLHLAKRAIRQRGFAILVEGYFDLAQALQAEIAPVVATCGTALTERQAKLLRRFCTKVLLSFDPDAAGVGASARSGELLIAAGFQVNVVRLPDGQDPDTAIRQHGAAYYVDRLKRSTPYLDYVLERAASSRDLTRESQRTGFVNEMRAIAARIPDVVARDQFADRIAHRAGATEAVVRDAIRQEIAGGRPKSPETSPEGTAAPDPQESEKGLIWAVMHQTEEAQQVLLRLEPAHFKGLRTASILEMAHGLAGVPAEGMPEAMLERLTEEETALVRAIAAIEMAPAGVEDCGDELRRRRHKRDLAEVQDEIDRRQRDGAPGAIDDALLARKLDLQRQLAALDTGTDLPSSDRSARRDIWLGHGT